MVNGLNKALAHLADAFRMHMDDTRGAASDSRDRDPGYANAGDATPNWHGDHWQNLLSAPMDARRYILEDWNNPVEPATDVDEEGRIDSFSGRRVHPEVVN